MRSVVSFIVSLVVLTLSIVTLRMSYQNYKTLKASERTLCFMILDRFGEKDKDCQEYVEEWKALEVK